MEVFPMQYPVSYSILGKPWASKLDQQDGSNDVKDRPQSFSKGKMPDAVSPHQRNMGSPDRPMEAGLMQDAYLFGSTPQNQQLGPVVVDWDKGRERFDLDDHAEAAGNIAFV